MAKGKLHCNLLHPELCVTEKCFFAIGTDMGNFFQTISLEKSSVLQMELQWSEREAVWLALHAQGKTVIHVSIARTTLNLKAKDEKHNDAFIEYVF